MKRTRLLSMLLAVLLVLSLLPSPVVWATKDPVSFAGNRTVEFTFNSSDLENYANGGRAAVDLYLRKHAPQWLSYTLGATGYQVQLTYSFDFSSYNDYVQKLASLLTYHPGILYAPGEELVLVEEFEANLLLGSLQAGLGESGNLFIWAHITRNVLILNGEEYDFTGREVEILPQSQPQIQLRSLNITTSQEGDMLTRTIAMVISTAYTEHEQWEDLVRRCEKLGDTTQEEAGDVLNFSVELQACDERSLTQKTSQCLDMPVSLSVQTTAATEDGCAYLHCESFLLTGYLEEGGSFYYRYNCPQGMTDPAALSEQTDLSVEEVEQDGQFSTVPYIQARNQGSIKFSYSAPFRFDSVSIHTDWPSALKEVRRTITLTAPAHTAQVYHETIKEALTDAMPKGTTLEIYDQDQVRYYALTFSAWFWNDIEDFTNAFLDTELTLSDSWLPGGESSYAEDLSNTAILSDFGPAHSIQVSYSFPGTSKSFSDMADTVQFEYQHLNLVKLAVELLGLAILAVVVLILVKKLGKTLKNRPVKVKAPKAAKAPQPVSQFCGNCGTPLGPQDTFCPNCGTPRT